MPGIWYRHFLFLGDVNHFLLKIAYNYMFITNIGNLSNKKLTQLYIKKVLPYEKIKPSEIKRN
jgi:hypothetical protein